MASTPLYGSKGAIGVADVSTANTNRDGTGTIATILTGVAAGTKINRITAKSTGDVADSVLTLYLHDGTTAHLFDEIDLGNPAAGSTTAEAGTFTKRYEDLILPSTSWSFRAAITVAPTSGVIKVFAFGVELT